MIAAAPKTTQKKNNPTVNKKGLSLQRKCSCGRSSKLNGQCDQCKKQKLLGMQKRLQVGSDNDSYEQEADRIAAKVLAIPEPTDKNPEPIPVSNIPFIRRRVNESTIDEPDAPEIVHEVLRSSGQPLHSEARENMETRFGHDFSGIKIHTDARAVASAASVDARAYTVGQNIVFGSGAYAPSSISGQELLAHELVHTIQQGNVTDGSRLSRKGGSFGGFFRNLGRGIAGLFGLEPKYDESTLLEYLKGLEKNNDIEYDFDSDNKARAVVLHNLYKKQSLKIRILLVKELLSGFTGDEDEQAILAILENAASLKEREKIAENVTYAALYDNFHTKELDSLYVLLPMMKIFHPREKEQTTVHSLEEYIKKWEKEKGRTITANERLALAKGCIGITMLQLGRDKVPNLSLCYGSFERAWMSARDMNEYLAQYFPDRKILIFSKRFWSGGNDYSADAKTGEVDMSKYNYAPKPGYVNYDYGFYDEATNKWWHANHCDPGVLGVRCKGTEARAKNLPDPMKVYESNLPGYSRPLEDFDAQVFCLGIAKIN